MRGLKVVMWAGIGVALVAGAPGQGAIVRFQSPSANIACAGDTTPARNQVRCDIREKNWSAPPKPAWCDFDWGTGLWVASKGKARWNCVSDTVLGAGRVLRYGKSIRVGGIRCWSSRTRGITCRNTVGHGFRINRQFARRF